jgi:hypothetical protein
VRLWERERQRARTGRPPPPAIITGKNRRKAGAVRAPNQNIENNPMQSSRARRLDGCFTPENILTRRANQRHYPTIAQFEIAHGAAHRLSARLQPKNPHN